MINLKNKGYHCWVINKTNMKVCVSDLFLTLQPNSTTDILDYKHSALSVEQVEKSKETGSLRDLKNREFIAYRIERPLPINDRKIDISKVTLPKYAKTNVKIEERKFKELDLDLDPESFANDNAESAVAEHLPKINIREQSNNMEYIVENDKIKG